MRYLLAIIFLLLCTGPARAEENMRVVVFGDSLTSGFELQAGESYASKLYYKLREIGYTNVEVVDLSQAGQSTTVALERIGEVTIKRPDVVVVQLGSNDALRGINADLVYKNLVDIVGKLQQHRAYVVLLGNKAPESLGYSYVKQFEALYNKLVEFYRVAYYPSVLEGISSEAGLNLADGYHPNGKGIDVIVNNTYLLVDAGLRWKWKLLSEQQHYSTDDQQALPPAIPSLAEPQALPPAVR